MCSNHITLLRGGRLWHYGGGVGLLCAAVLLMAIAATACYQPTYTTRLVAVDAYQQPVDGIKFYALTPSQLSQRGGNDCLPPHQVGKCNVIALLHDLKMLRNNTPQQLGAAPSYHLLAVRYRGRVPQIVGYRQVSIPYPSNTIYVVVDKH